MGAPTRIDLREVVNALLYLNRTGCPWRLLPVEFPNWNTVRYYFDLIDVMIDSFSGVPSPYSMIALEQMGGAVARVPDSATAFQSRKAAFSLLILSGWVDPADSDVNVAWARDVWEKTRPLSSSDVYVNYLGAEGEGRVRAAYGVNHARLRDVKRKYDPHNFFRLNQNIEPAAT